LTTMLSSIVKRLPPTRVLMGAGFALASYFVTSVWKENIDGKISAYADIINKASSMEARLAALPMSQASLRYLADDVELQKFQIELMNEKARTDYRLARTYTLHPE
jgi:hypothetical protein